MFNPSKLNVGAKERQSQTTLDKLFADVEAKYIRGKGASGSRFELTVKHLASAKGLQTDTIAETGKTDVIVYVGGKRIRIEVKTGCGIVAQLKPTLGDTIDNYSVDDLLPDVDLIAFAPRASEFEDIDELLDETLMVSVKAFAEFLIDNSGKRKHSFGTAFKLSVNNNKLRDLNEAIPARPVVDKKGNPVLEEDGTPKMTKRGIPRWTDCITMQEAYRQQIIEAVQDNAETHELRTLGEWLEEIGRA